MVRQLRVAPAKVFRAVALPVLAMIMFGGELSAEPRHIVTGGRNNELSGYLVKCGAVSSVEVRAPNGSYFETDRGEFGKLARNMRYIISGECKPLRKITFTGKVNGVLWYAGAVSIDQKWRLFGIYAPPQ